MRHALKYVAAVLALALVSATGARAEDAKKPEVVVGYIHAVDGSAKTFVLGGKNESQTTFKVAVTNEGNREAAHVLLDGKKTTFEEAVQAKRKASVTYLKVGDELWVWKVDVTSATK